MAGMTGGQQAPAAPPPLVWTRAQSRAQYGALATLRWNLFRNNFRRKGGKGELVARLVFLPILVLIAAGPIAGAGFFGYESASAGHMNLMPALMWGIFLLWQLVSINISAPNLSFDIDIIVRFPLSFGRYLAARLVFGLLSAANVIGTLAAVAASVGIGIARPALAPWAMLVLAVFAVSNIFFTRMIFAWIDRWLSTRRAREVLTAFVLFASLGFQYLNVTFNPGLQGEHHHHVSTHLPLLLKIFHGIVPVAAVLPPGLAATSLEAFAAGRYSAAILALLGLAIFAALFLAVYAWRMRREFLGENLSELTQTRKEDTPAAPAVITKMPTFGLDPVVAACIQKELIYLRRSTNQLYGFLAPVFMVFLFSSRIASSGAMGGLLFPAAIAYSILGISILSYNCLGMDAAGFQFYLIAPVRVRQVILAKNLILFALGFIEFVLIYAVVSFTAHPPTLLMTLATLLWLISTTLVNAAIGNIRSIVAPTKTDLSKVSRKQVSQLSALIALGFMAVACVAGFAVVWWAGHIHLRWIMLPIFLIFAGAGWLTYQQVLRRIDGMLPAERENLIEVLAKS